MGSLPATTEAARFGKYSLVARLATGGMAEIFLARLQGAASFAKLVCIKRILPHLARDKQFVAMFLDEARIASRISHPNVCQVFELGEIDGSYYLAMEYLEGVPLGCFRQPDGAGERPDPRLVAGIAVQACEGLHHAHQLKNADGSVMEVVHRDVSPQNLFVTVDGVVKVLDFGIAKIQDASVRTTTGAVKGTYAYMAPEQLRGERVDRRTDVFAMGIVMWETLVRRHLFKRDTEFLTFQAITSDPIEDIAALRPDIPAALAQVIMTALSRERDARFPTTRALAEAITATLAPLAAPAISAEIGRLFPAELAEQATLVRIAHEGGALDLDLDRGPAIARSALMTTPVSGPRSGPGSAPGNATIAGPGVGTGPGQGGRVASAALAAVAAPGTGPGVGSAAGAGRSIMDSGVEADPRVGLRFSSSQPAVLPTAPLRSWRPLWIAALALTVGGLAAYVWMRVTRDPAPAVIATTAPSPIEAPPPAPVIAPPAAGSAAPPSVVAPPTVAAPTTPPSIAPSSSASAPAPDEPPPPVSAPTTRDPRAAAKAASDGSDRRARPRTPSVTGPPGYITIDSAPLYAVIYIDGKNYGETPLVRLALPPGRHVVHAVAPSGATRDVRITIESGKVAPASRIEW